MQLSRRLAAATLAATTVAVAAGCGGHSGSKPASAQSPASSANSSGAAAHRGPTCPLTGAQAKKGDDVHRVALAVKIDNLDQARPQAGLNQADVVVEELVEGGLTRLMAIFQCGRTGLVGPIRSARISDADILALLHGSVLGYSGANPQDLPPIQAHSDAVLISQDALPQYFHRDLSRAAPHNVFSSTSTLLAAGQSRRHGLHAPKPLFTYSTSASAGHHVHSFSLHWPATEAAWTYSKGHYLRDQNGTADTTVSGGQASATNVVVLGVDISSSGLYDVDRSPSPIDDTVGSNPAWVFRDGREIKGTWHRKSITAPLRLRGKHGKTIALSPGRTWIELLPRPSSPSLG